MYKDMFNESNVIILLQGSSGVTKTTLAKKIKLHAELKGLTTIICSADDCFINNSNNIYKFNRVLLQDAHNFCKNKFNKAIDNNINWIIVDNTNVDLKSIRPYYNPDNGYKYKVVRPNVNWYFDADECFKKNTHNVPLETIERMINSIRKFSLEEVRADILWI